MSEERREVTILVPIGYRTTRLVFLAGLLLDLILYFVPALGFGGEEKSLSPLDVTRLYFQRGEAGWGFLNVAFFAATAVVLFLAWEAAQALGFRRRRVDLRVWASSRVFHGVVRERSTILPASAAEVPCSFGGFDGLLDQTPSGRRSPSGVEAELEKFGDRFISGRENRDRFIFLTATLNSPTDKL